ncbi:unnamed protein product [Alopecurus aequalis]
MADLPIELYHERKRKKRKRAAGVFFVSVVSIAQHIYCKRKILELGDFSEEEAETRVRKQMLRNIYLGRNEYCYDTLRFTKRSFFDLCAILRERAGLKDTFYMSVEEAVAIFLLVLSHGMKFRLIRSTYRWTLEPVSRHFNEVLRAVLSLSHELIKLPDPAAELPEDNRWKWFPDGLGALDGTHIKLRVPVHKQGRYRNRKHDITTNVLGVCDRSMKFVYVLAGWEGSASDSRVLRDAMFREDAFKVPSGKYYLVDAGYTNGPGFLAPFRSTRYHLKEWAAAGNNPQTPQELYNLRHASARNIVERIFAFIKMRWAILRTSSFFGIRNQIRVINACCILHNFLVGRQREMDDLMLLEVDNQINNAAIDAQEEHNMIRHVEVSRAWNNKRMTLANQMWADYQARRGHGNI